MAKSSLKMRSISSINAAYRKIRKEFGENSEVVKDIKKTLDTTNDLITTDSGYISTKTTNTHALSTANLTISTMTRIFDKWIDLIIESNEAALDDGAKPNELISIPKTKEEKIAISNYLTEMYNDYGESLAELYAIRDDISSTVDDISELKADLADILEAIRHPGTWALPVPAIISNEEKINKLKRDYISIKENV